MAYASGTSGALSTTNTYIKYKISIVENSYSTTDNTSNVTVTINFYRTNTGYTTYGSGTVYCTINGTSYTASVTSSQKITNSGINLFSKTVTVSHDSDGSKTLAVSAYISHSQFSSSSQSYSLALTTIPRKSSLSVASGTLDVAQTLTVTRQSTSFTHTIVAVCGSASTTICTKSSSTSISFTPPASWASQNTTGTSLSVKYTITTYNGSTSLGSNSYTVTCTIPSTANYKPTCAISVSDSTGYSSTYGGYIKGKSKLQVTVTPTLAYSSSIASYKTTANGSTYVESSFTTGVVTQSGTLTISASVTDKRGRSGSASASVTALNYSQPNISTLSVKRCDSNGTENDQGEYIQVTFSASVTSLNNKNSAAYKLHYGKSSETTRNVVDFTQYNNVYSVSNATYIFAADSGSSYVVYIYATDDFGEVVRFTSASTAATIMHFRADGTGIGLGKIAETANTLEVGYDANFTKDVEIDGEAAFYGDTTTAGTANFDGNAVFSSNVTIDGPTALNGPTTTFNKDVTFNGSIVIGSNTLTDYIIEEGTEDFWIYEKWASGKAVCYGKKNFGNLTTKAWGSMYNTADQSITFPTGLFIENPQYIDLRCLYGGGYGAIVESGYQAPSKDGFSGFSLVRSSNITFSNATLGIHVIGKWK